MKLTKWSSDKKLHLAVQVPTVFFYASDITNNLLFKAYFTFALLGGILIETIHVPSDGPIIISVALSFLKRFYPAVDFFDYSIVPKCGITFCHGPGNSAYDCSFPDFHVLHPLQFHCVKMMAIHSLTPFAGTALDWFKAYY